MNKQQIITKIKEASKASFGSENCYAIQRVTGLSYTQIKNVYDKTKRPTFETILKMCEAIGLEIDLKPKETCLD